MKHVSLDQLSAQQFADSVHTTFHVAHQTGNPIPLQLLSVTRQTSSGSPFEVFSLLFNGPGNRPLDQRTYPVSHERLGVFELFLVPVSTDHTGRQYEAIINRRSAAQC